MDGFWWDGVGCDQLRNDPLIALEALGRVVRPQEDFPTVDFDAGVTAPLVQTILRNPNSTWHGDPLRLRWDNPTLTVVL
jgi:hypothetical protein